MSPVEVMDTRHHLYEELEKIEERLLAVLCQPASNRVLAEARNILEERADKADELKAAGYHVAPVEEVYEVLQQTKVAV